MCTPSASVEGSLTKKSFNESIYAALRLPDTSKFPVIPSLQAKNPILHILLQAGNKMLSGSVTALPRTMNPPIRLQPVRARHQAVGARSRLSGNRHFGYRSRARSPRLLEWLDRGWHGEMDYMARHGVKRARPGELIPGTLRIVSARLNYKPRGARESWPVIGDPQRAFVSRYALGRDYHKVLRNKLQALAKKIEAAIGPYRYRVFTDSAPVMEVALARKAGLGWRGKHTLLLTREAGSMFFSARSTPICRCPPIRPSASTAVRAGNASMSARRRRSSRPTSSTRAAAFPISPSSTRARFPRSCARSSATASTAATTASWSARGTNTRRMPARTIFRCATGSTM